MMPPVVGFERRRALRRRERVDAIAGPAEHESERGPGFGRRRIEPARIAGVMNGARQRRASGAGSARVVSNRIRHAFARPTCAAAYSGTAATAPSKTSSARDDLSGFERLERRPALDKSPVRREQRVESGVGFACRSRSTAAPNR